MKTDAFEKKKKILLMVPMLHQGGFERVCVQTARLLAPYYQVAILIFSAKDVNYDVSGLEVIDIDMPGGGGWLHRLRNVFRRARRVRRIKQERGIDIAYSFGTSANLVNVFSRTGEKVLTGLRCSTDMDNPWQIRLFVKRSNRVLSCSREILRELKVGYDCEEGRLLYNPLDAAEIRKEAEEKIDDFPFPKTIRSDTGQSIPVKTIVTMGRDDYIKGLWHLIKAFAVVAGERPEARLLILGAGFYEGCRTLTKTLGIEEKVAFPGIRKNPFPYVAGSELYVLASNHEGFPNALLEAMALGKPIIAADCKTGPREILLSAGEYEELQAASPDGKSIKKSMDGAYGVLIPDMSAQPDYDARHITDEDIVLASEIFRMFGEPGRMREYGKKAAERAEAFSPERYLEELTGILDEVTGGK